MRKFIFWGAGLAVSAYLAIAALIYFSQEKLIFAGEPLPPDYQFSYDVAFAEYDIPVADATLNALHFKQQAPVAMLFFLHGNSGNLKRWAVNPEYYRDHNVDLFMLDYRGYGKSTGVISSQAQLETDVMAAWNYIAQPYLDAGIPIIIYGRSLGSALATTLAAKVDAKLLVLVSPFANMGDLAFARYPWLPQFLLKYPLKTDQRIKAVEERVVLIHGDQDELISFSHSERLQQIVGANSMLHIIEGAGHGDIHDFENYLAILADYMTGRR